MSLVIVAANSGPLITALSQLDELLRSQKITVIIAGVDEPALHLLHQAGLEVVALPAVGVLPGERALAQSTVGRTLLRLSPADRGVRLARSIRRSAAAAASISGAQVIVAADRDAVLATWRAARRAPQSTTAVVGLPALAAIIRRSTADGSVIA